MVAIAKINLGEAGLAGLRDKVAVLNKRAVRHGMNEVIVTVLSEGWVTFNRGEENEYTDYRYDVEISGCEPCIDGWRLIARVEFNEIIGNVVRIAPGIDDDCSFQQYREIGPVCEHCNSLRRRNDVFVLQHSDGSRKIVGRNCLADFVRNGDANAFARYAEWCDQISGWTSEDCDEYAESELGYGSRGGRPVKPLDQYLPVVAMCIRRMGWVSRTKAKEAVEETVSSTADHAANYFYGRGRWHRDWIKFNELYLSDEDKDLAARAIEWAKTVDASQSEYYSIINRIANANAVEIYRLDGYAASIIIAYQKACDLLKERADKNKAKVWIGSTGERLRDLPVRIVRVRYYENDWGTKTIVAMEADMPDGAIAPITWFASGSKDFDEGSEAKLTATIKDYNDDDRFGKQTIVQRAKLV